MITTTPIATVGASIYVDHSAAAGVTYYYLVEATNAAGTSGVSNEATTAPYTVPGLPTGLTATAGSAKITLAWTAPAATGGSPLTGYRIFRGTTSGGETLTTPLSTVGATATTFTDITATAGTTYYYEVEATNVAGASGVSNEASATAVTAPTAPSAPTGLSATPGVSLIRESARFRGTRAYQAFWSRAVTALGPSRGISGLVVVQKVVQDRRFSWRQDVKIQSTVAQAVPRHCPRSRGGAEAVGRLPQN